MLCHCQSNKPFESCCQPFLTGKQLPSTAIELMRSRYSAFVVANIDYIVETQIDPFHLFESDSALDWAKQSQWKGLEIIATQDGKAGDKTGVVEFKAYFDDEIHHEVSEFVFEGRWYFKFPRL